MPIITSANLASAIVKLVAADALPTLMGNLVMGNLVTRDYDTTLAKAGDTVNVPIPPTLIANNILEGGAFRRRTRTWAMHRSSWTHTLRRRSRFRTSQKRSRCRRC